MVLMVKYMVVKLSVNEKCTYFVTIRQLLSGQVHNLAYKINFCLIFQVESFTNMKTNIRANLAQGLKQYLAESALHGYKYLLSQHGWVWRALWVNVIVIMFLIIIF